MNLYGFIFKSIKINLFNVNLKMIIGNIKKVNNGLKVFQICLIKILFIFNKIF